MRHQEEARSLEVDEFDREDAETDQEVSEDTLSNARERTHALDGCC